MYLTRRGSLGRTRSPTHARRALGGVDGFVLVRTWQKFRLLSVSRWHWRRWICRDVSRMAWSACRGMMLKRGSYGTFLEGCSDVDLLMTDFFVVASSRSSVGSLRDQRRQRTFFKPDPNPEIIYDGGSIYTLHSGCAVCTYCWPPEVFYKPRDVEVALQPCFQNHNVGI